jgi:UDP-2,4-diacetamido-2,4,6-trideoxy-beta-L-altropyranose hydrolase
LRRPEPRIAIRVDATDPIGTGHFMRCLALADMLHVRGARVQFVTRALPSHLHKLAAHRGHALAILPAPLEPGDCDDLAHSAWLGTSQRTDTDLTRTALAGGRVDWLIVDHYALDARWESALRPCTGNILVIDDLADRTHDCDALLDQNLHEDMQARYASRVPAHCRLLLGPKYALLREEFATLRASWHERDGDVRRILILMGGVDADNLTSLAIEAVSSLPRVPAVDVVVGARNPARDAIAVLCRTHGYALHVQPSNVAELMASADLAIGAGGVAAWERCCAGLPTLTLCSAQNQREQINQLALQGLAYVPEVHPGNADALATHLRALLENPALRAALSRNGLRAVDGRGTQRVAGALGCGAVEMRVATLADSARLLTWRNHPAIRAVSESAEPIDPTVHEKWLAAVLADPDRHLLVGEQDGQAVGVVRFDVSDGAADVSIYLVPGLEGHGRGSELLQAAEAWLAASRPAVLALNARVLRDNQSSHGLFAACGYRRISTVYAKELARR